MPISQPGALQIAAPGGQPASPEQKRFNQLVKKIEKARETLAAWQEQTAQFAQAHALRVRPLILELGAARQALAFALDAALTHEGWTKTERRTLELMICELSGALIDGGFDDADGTLKALFDRHAEVDYETGNRQQLDAMKNMFETMSGIDLGDEALASEDDILLRAREQLAARAQSQEERGAGRRPGAAERRREEEARQATQSLREVYRKLASALHPDRAEGPADHASRTAQMQRVNQAYEKNDLLALLSLQLEIEQIDEHHLAGAPAQRIKHFNKVLAEQLEEIEAEIGQRQAAFYAGFGYMPQLRTAPLRLGRLLDDERRELQAALAAVQRDRAALANPAIAKRWVKHQRLQRREAARGGEPLF